jgi:hypothetical protein
MPILKAIGKNKDKKKGSTKQTLSGMKAVLNYIARAGREEQIYKSFGMGLSDNVDKANNTIVFNKKTHDKVDNNLYKHFALSFPPGFDNLEIIEKITREFVQKEFVDKGFLAFVGIHIDKDHYHSHILVDTVNFNTGYKLHQLNNADLKKARYKDKILPEQEISLQHLKDSMEEISLKYGVESPKKDKENKKNKSINIGKMAKYKGVTKENSWRTKISKVFEEVVLNVTTTVENLQDRLKEKGIFFNRFNKEKKSLTLGTMYEDKGESKKGLVKLNTLEKEEDYRFQVTKNIYNWDNLWEELDKHKVKLLEQEQEKEKNNDFNLDLDVFDEIEKEIKLELEKDKELSKSKTKTKTYTLEEEKQIEENTRKYIENFNKKQALLEKSKENKSVEKKDEPRIEKNAIEDAIKNQRLAEEQRLKDLANEESNKKKKKISYSEDKEKEKDTEKEL